MTVFCAALYLLALFEGSRLGTFDGEQLKARIAELCALPGVIERQLEGWRERMTALGLRLTATLRTASVQPRRDLAFASLIGAL